MTINYPYGSTWSKWDLHVHTPSSIIHNYGANTDDIWEKFISDLEKLPRDFKVIGINDYIFVDGYERILNAKQNQGRLANIDLLLPIVEFRLDKFAGVVKKDKDGSYSRSDWNRINLHIIFDQLDPEIIRQQFLSSLVPCYHLIPDSSHLNGKWQAVITRDSIAKLGQMIIDAAPEDKKSDYGNNMQEGFNNLCVSLESIQKALQRHDLSDRHLLAVGKTEWNNMKWDDQSIAEKRNVINCVDLVFTASENPEAYYSSREKLIKSNVTNKLLDCSDAHEFSNSENKDRIGNCFTWLKANPTFEGLRHAVTEFDQRVFIGDTPPKKLIVSNNRTKYTSKIKIHKKEDSPLKEVWFDVEVPLNSDLVAIIGNKGSGKSALADVIALVGDTKNHGSFSFLNDKRFRDPKSKLASHFIGTLFWQDNSDTTKELHQNPDRTNVERVKYLPQSYLEDLCNELASSGSSTFDNELRKIIYTHVPEEDRLGFLSLNELLCFKVSELESERKQCLQEMSKINKDIVLLEQKLSPGYRQSLERQLDSKRNELLALDTAKPVDVDDPQTSESTKAETATTATKLTELEEQLNQIKNDELLAREKKAEALRAAANISRIQQAIKNHKKNHDQFILELKGMISEVNSSLIVEDILSLKIDTTNIEQFGAKLKSEIDAQEIILSGPSESSLLQKRQKIEDEIKNLKGQLGEKQRLFLVYKEQIKQWEQSKKDIQGDKDKTNTITWYETEIEALNSLPAKRDELKANRLNIVRRLHEQITRLVEEYRTLYRPVQAFVQSPTYMDMPLPLDFNVRIAEMGFQDNFFSYINRQTRGSFSGIDESNLLIKTALQETDFMDVESVLGFIERIDDLLHYDRRIEGSTTQNEISVSDQLRKGQQVETLYDYLFGLQYLSPQYSLTYGGQEISQLSPGERGLLLLVFYLLVDKDDIPLVIDQPEENLDNQTIYKILVTCIKTAKQKRQIIMVTHNPNLAVVCDAEQIICASCDKSNKSFTYISGAIEEPEIKARVIEILEGTKPAFINRRRKYGVLE